MLSRRGLLFSKAVLSLPQAGLPAVQAAPAVVAQRPQHYQEPAMPFPVVQPTTVASLQLGQPQPVLAGQQVRTWLLPKNTFSPPVPCLCSVPAPTCSKSEGCETMELPLGRLRDGAKGVGFKGGKSNGLMTIVVWYLRAS